MSIVWEKSVARSTNVSNTFSMQRFSIKLTEEMRATLALLEKRYELAPLATLGKVALERG